MTRSERLLGQLFWSSLLRPAEAAPVVLGLRLPRDVLWSALVLVSILAALVTWAQAALVPVPEGALPEAAGPAGFYLGLSPMSMALMVFALMVMMTFVLHFVGRSLGGQGSFPGALLTVVWTQGAFLVLDLALLAILLILPPLVAVAQIGAILLMGWVLVNFVDRLHGFQSLGRAFLCIVVGFIGLIFGLSLILGVISATAFGMGAAT